MGWRSLGRTVVALAATLVVHGGVAAQGTGAEPAAEVPVRWSRGWFVVPVVANGSDSLTFILDTGAAISVVTESTAARLGLTPGSPVDAQGTSGTQRVATTTMASLTLDRVTRRDVRVLVLADAVLQPDDTLAAPADGVLGVDVFGSFDVHLDPLGGVLRLYEPGDGPSPEVMARLAEPLRLRRLRGGLVGHDVSVSGVTIPAVLDTGARHVVLSVSAAEAATLETSRTGTRSRGVGTAPVDVSDTRLDDLRIGTTVLPPLDAQVADLPIFGTVGPQGAPRVLLGSPVFRRCPLFISYRDGTVRYCRAIAPA